jgi:hypothetical protein
MSFGEKDCDHLANGFKELTDLKFYQQTKIRCSRIFFE